MSDQLPNQDLPTPLRGLSPEQLEGLRQFFIQGLQCARCEWPIVRQDPAPSEVDKKAFLRAVLGEGDFTKVYGLYDGKLSFTFRALNTAQSLALSDLSKQVPAANAYEHEVEMFRLKLLFYLAVKNKDVFEPPAEVLDFEQARKLYGVRFGQWNEGLLALAIRSLQEFLRLEALLMNGGLDKAFWQSAGLV